MKTKHAAMLIACVMLAALLLGALGGVSLVNAAAQEASAPDRLIGVLVTRDYLDLFDIEQYLTDNASRISRGKALSDSDAEKYQGRLYAELTETPLYDDEGRETYSDKRFVFPGVEGIGYFSARVTEEFGDYWTSGGDEGISDGNAHITVTDAGESISLSGTIYAVAGGAWDHFYYNPVYQTSSGEVYALGGNGIFLSGDMVAGASMSQKLTEEHTETVGEKSSSSFNEVEVTICLVDAPTAVFIAQFDGEDRLLSREEYAPGALPETLRPLEDTRYIVVETAARDGEPARALYGPEDETLSAFYCREDGICVKQWCAIDWDI